MYKARVFAEDDTLLTACVGTLQDVRDSCAKHFVGFDSTPAIQGYLDTNFAYAKGYQSVKSHNFLITPVFVHISAVSFPYVIV